MLRIRALSPMGTRQRWTVNVTFASVILLLVCSASAQYDHVSSEPAQAPATSPKKLEDTVVTDMLRIVDNKFDTLTTRITSLERAVSNLQFFSIRQFRGVSGSLQEVTKGVESLSRQVGLLKVDGHGFKISSRLLHREVIEIKSVTNALSSEIASSGKEVNGNIDKQSQFIRAFLEDSLLKSRQDFKEDLQNTIEETVVAKEEDKQPTNCSVDFAPMHDHVDQRLTQLKSGVYNDLSSLLKSHRSETTTKCDDILSRYQADTRRQLKSMQVRLVTSDNKDLRENNTSHHAAFTASKKTKFNVKKAKQSTTADLPPRGLVGIVGGRSRGPPKRPEQSPSNVHKNITKTNPDMVLQNENDAMVMEALINMTTSVQQAVSYFRNTAHLLEVIVSNTDMLLNDKNSQKEVKPLPLQDENRLRFQGAPFSGGPAGFEVSSAFHRNHNSESPVGDVPVPKREQSCSFPAEVVGSMTNLVKNGSQLLEILTDLAQMSSMSLLKATENLQTQLSSVEGVKDSMNAALVALGDAASDSSEKEELVKISNTTNKVLKAVESISTNTGWLSAIFHNVKNLDSVGNRTLHYVSLNHGMLRRLVRAAMQRASVAESSSNGIRIVRGRENRLSEMEFTLDKQFFETIYGTSSQLSRIMPALTKLLAEPDPLFTLVNGGRLDQGRVEIYHRGKWGTVCHQDITHEEANIICRHLGFQGGISAGAGHFDAGSGVSWSINASCLATDECGTVKRVTTAEACSHDRDAAVICDHMLRIVPTDSSTENTTGRLEMHHRGLWLPLCDDGWNSYSARVACRQMGHSDGRKINLEKWTPQGNTTWLSRVNCDGKESRLDACQSYHWAKSCNSLKPGGVRCM